MSTDQDSKILDWARENPKFRKYENNIDLLRQLYAKHHTPKTVVEVIEGQNAELTLLIVKEFKRRNPIMLCSGCGKKSCDVDKCGKEDYKEKQSYNFMAGDRTGQIMVSVPPWFEGDGELVAEEEYKVTGSIKMFQDKPQINIESAELIAEDLSGAIQAAEEAMDLYKGEVKQERFMQMMKGYEGQIEQVMKKLNLVEDGDMIKRG